MKEIMMSLGEAYMWKLKHEDAETEIIHLREDIEDRQNIIDIYRKHYAKHSFKPIITHYKK